MFVVEITARAYFGSASKEPEEFCHLDEGGQGLQPSQESRTEMSMKLVLLTMPAALASAACSGSSWKHPNSTENNQT